MEDETIKATFRYGVAFVDYSPLLGIYKARAAVVPEGDRMVTIVETNIPVVRKKEVPGPL